MIDNAGGGLNISAKGGGSKTAICTDVGAGQTGAIGVDPNLTEITAHELLGHGYGGNHGTAGHGHVDALHMSNLVRQKMKSKNLRNGNDHADGVIVSPIEMKGIPNHFKGIDGIISQNTSNIQWIGKGSKYQIKFYSMKATPTTGKYFKVTNLTGDKKDYEDFRDDKGVWHFKGGPADK